MSQEAMESTQKVTPPTEEASSYQKLIQDLTTYQEGICVLETSGLFPLNEVRLSCQEDSPTNHSVVMSLSPFRLLMLLKVLSPNNSLDFFKHVFYHDKVNNLMTSSDKKRKVTLKKFLTSESDVVIVREKEALSLTIMLPLEAFNSFTQELQLLSPQQKIEIMSDAMMIHEMVTSHHHTKIQKENHALTQQCAHLNQTVCVLENTLHTHLVSTPSLANRGTSQSHPSHHLPLSSPVAYGPARGTNRTASTRIPSSPYGFFCPCTPYYVPVPIVQTIPIPNNAPPYPPSPTNGARNPNNRV